MFVFVFVYIIPIVSTLLHILFLIIIRLPSRFHIVWCRCLLFPRRFAFVYVFSRVSTSPHSLMRTLSLLSLMRLYVQFVRRLRVSFAKCMRGFGQLYLPVFILFIHALLYLSLISSLIGMRGDLERGDPLELIKAGVHYCQRAFTTPVPPRDTWSHTLMDGKQRKQDYLTGRTEIVSFRWGL